VSDNTHAPPFLRSFSPPPSRLSLSLFFSFSLLSPLVVVALSTRSGVYRINFSDGLHTCRAYARARRGWGREREEGGGRPCETRVGFLDRRYARLHARLFTPGFSLLKAIARYATPTPSASASRRPCTRRRMFPVFRDGPNKGVIARLISQVRSRNARAE